MNYVSTALLSCLFSILLLNTKCSEYIKAVAFLYSRISRSSGGPSYSFSNSTFCRDGRTRAFPDELFTGPNNPLLRTDDSDSDDGAEQNMQQKAAVKTQDLQQKARPKQAQAQAQAKGPSMNIP